MLGFRAQLLISLKDQEGREEDGGDQDEESDPEFDEEEFKLKFDDENPPIEEPPEVIDDLDLDFNIDIVEEEPE